MKRSISFSILALSLGLLSSELLAQSGTCPLDRPILQGPQSLQAGQSYSVSWTNVLADRLSPSDFYILERSSDPTFATKFDRIKTSRAAQALPAGPAGESVLYHRVIVTSTCPVLASGPIISNVLGVRVKSDCLSPEPVGELSVSPAKPPAFTTYVVSWSTSGGTDTGPGGAPTGDKYRLRRVAPYESKETVSEAGSAAFSDPPGDYTYQVRAEAACGTAGPWSLPIKVTVSGSSNAALSLLSEPKPIAIVGGSGGTSFVVRNGGTQTVTLAVTADSPKVTVTPATLKLEPNRSDTLNVSVSSTVPDNIHATVQLRAASTVMSVPIDAVLATAPADKVVEWADVDVTVDLDGNAVLRTLVNPGDTEAAFVAAIRQPWVSIEAVDGLKWDRPLRPRETRVVAVKVDRARRRASTGTETAAVTLTTVGHTDTVRTLVVTDDGPQIPYTQVAMPAPGTAKTRILYASMPNAKAVTGGGRFSSELWLTNLDAVSPIDVSLYLTPVGSAGGDAERRTVNLTLGAGETRRYRNVVGMVGFEGACAVEVRSAAPTLSSTALVNNTPIVAASARAARNALTGEPLTTTGNQYGFEMRPIAPGEGVKASDPLFVLSGLAHDSKRRTNVLLRETGGADTTVEITLFWSNADPVTRNDVPVRIVQTVPANGAIQLNDSEQEQLFGGVDPPNRDIERPSPYALVRFVSGYTDPFGIVRGSVAPIATVVDSGTEDASLRVGTSVRSLSPVPPLQVSSVRVGPVDGTSDSTASVNGLPFQGGPAPLYFPAAHSWGGRLTNGERPYWRTRVTLTNTSEGATRRLKFHMVDQSSNELTAPAVSLPPRSTTTYEDFVAEVFEINNDDLPLYGPATVEAVRKADGTWDNTWADVDVQTELYTIEPTQNTPRGQFSTGMEGFSYLHGYSSFQSNLGTVQFDGAESSSRYRTNLILQEVGNATCTVAVAAYLPGSFVPIATKTVKVPKLGYISKELFSGILELDLSEVTDVRVVVRQIDGDGVFMAFASRINLATGDPANIFLRPATAGTGR